MTETMHRKNRALKAAGVVAVVLVSGAASGCGSSSHSTTGSTPTTRVSSSSLIAPGTPAVSQDKLQSALLAGTDMPTGWSSHAPAKPSGSTCNKESVINAFPPSAMAEVQFVMGTDEPSLYEQLLSYPDASIAGQAFDMYQSNAESCTTYTQAGATIEVAHLTIPPHGDNSIGYGLTISQDGSSHAADIQVMTQGPVLLYISYAALVSDTDQLESFSKLAYDKAVRTLQSS